MYYTEGECLVVNTSTIYHHDMLKPYDFMEDNTVQICITSPPYWGLRNYNIEDQLGQENHPDLYIERIVQGFENVKRVLRKDGTLWVNIGDTYVGTGHKKYGRDPKYPNGRNGQDTALNNRVEGIKRKDMIGIPWMFAFAMRNAGWYLRSDIIWEKPNGMPSAVTDRPVSSYEHIFLFSKSQKYYYDWEAVSADTVDGKSKRRQRDVWRVNTKPFKEAHFAVYPEELITPCILAGSREGDIVFDPFSGTGTTGIAALHNNRNYIGLEQNKEYLDMSVDRILKETGTGTIVKNE